MVLVFFHFVIIKSWIKRHFYVYLGDKTNVIFCFLFLYDQNVINCAVR